MPNLTNVNSNLVQPILLPAATNDLKSAADCKALLDASKTDTCLIRAIGHLQTNFENIDKNKDGIIDGPELSLEINRLSQDQTTRPEDRAMLPSLRAISSKLSLFQTFGPWSVPKDKDGISQIGLIRLTNVLNTWHNADNAKDESDRQASLKTYDVKTLQAAQELSATAASLGNTSVQRYQESHQPISQKN